MDRYIEIKVKSPDCCNPDEHCAPEWMRITRANRPVPVTCVKRGEYAEKPVVYVRDGIAYYFRSRSKLAPKLGVTITVVKRYIKEQVIVNDGMIYDYDKDVFTEVEDGEENLEGV